VVRQRGFKQPHPSLVASSAEVAKGEQGKENCTKAELRRSNNDAGNGV